MAFAHPTAQPVQIASANRIEIALGRTAAACVHPVAAWYARQRSMRAMLLAGYFLIGFAAAFAALLFA